MVCAYIRRFLGSCDLLSSQSSTTVAKGGGIDYSKSFAVSQDEFNARVDAVRRRQLQEAIQIGTEMRQQTGG